MKRSEIWTNLISIVIYSRYWVCTWRHVLHVFGELATHTVVVGANVMEAPGRELFGIVELQKIHRKGDKMELAQGIKQ